MTFQSIIKFLEYDATYLTIQTSPKEKSQDMIVDTIFNMLFILSMGDFKFDSEIVDRLKFRIEQLRKHSEIPECAQHDWEFMDYGIASYYECLICHRLYDEKTQKSFNE